MGPAFTLFGSETESPARNLAELQSGQGFRIVRALAGREDGDSISVCP